VVSGGVDSALDPWGWVSQLSSGLVSTNPDPATAYRPFDATADGYVPGEGGAILVLEDAAAARARGVHQVYGEIAGHASTFDPPPGSGGPSGLRRAIEIALDDAGAQPQDVDLVVADGAGNPAADLDEARALAAVFGPGAVAVTAPKSRYGRVYAGGGPLDVVTALMAMKENVIPPTIGVGDLPGGYEIDLVRGQARPARVSCALVLARGRWGFNSAVVLRGH
jgi:act minimal PKS chain-length factor (CLF/KS beta)